MTIQLENEFIKATIAAKGAELQHLLDKQTNSDRMWNADPAFWGKTSPVLFPIVGALKDDTYFYNNKPYNLPRHGFARDHTFDISPVNDIEAIFTLSDTPETLKIYPFKFRFSIRYRLEGNKLNCIYYVSNPGEADLWFSVGAHPAFAVSTKSKNYNEYYLHFDNDRELKVWKIKDNLISNQTVAIPLPDGNLILDHELFYDDALVIKDLKSHRITLANSKQSSGLHFEFGDFPYFGIWAAKDADFVCLEPWDGIADGVDHDQQLEDKEGILKLTPGETWQKGWSVEVFDERSKR